jgi:hypothetical protein
MEHGAGTDQGDQVWGVDGAPAGLCGIGGLFGAVKMLAGFGTSPALDWRWRVSRSGPGACVAHMR